MNETKGASQTPKWHAMDPAEVISALRGNAEQGLSDEEATSRLSVYGPNEIQETKKESTWKFLLEQFKEVLILILIAAAVISILIGEVTDSVIILAIVFASTGLGFYQEYRAENSLALLRNLAAPSAIVTRDGQEKSVPAKDIVPGDLVILDPGDRVTAAIRASELWLDLCPSSRICGT